MAPWIFLSVLSAIFLGLYDVAKKTALKGNAVPPVLMVSTVTASVVWLPLIILSRHLPHAVPHPMLTVESLSWLEHGMLFFKSALAGTSWIFAFFALKHLPLSIASPIRATSPIWTIWVATLWMGESPSANQWLGIVIILSAFYAFSLVGLKEGIRFSRDRWVGCMMIATVLGALSALYDKHLLQRAGFSPATTQAWFSIYLVVVMAPLTLHWYTRMRRETPFHWRWQIPLIGITLLVADFLYFSAIAYPDALIAVISPVRRSSILIAFATGIVFLKETNGRPKAICVTSLLVGVYILSW
ncbi:MAG: DMT family transporter [Pirellulaceae bacterium]